MTDYSTFTDDALRAELGRINKEADETQGVKDAWGLVRMHRPKECTTQCGHCDLCETSELYDWAYGMWEAARHRARVALGYDQAWAEAQRRISAQYPGQRLQGSLKWLYAAEVVRDLYAFNPLFAAAKNV